MTDQLDDRLHKALSTRAKEALRNWPLPKQEPQLLKYRENAVFRVTLADGKPAALRLHRPGYHGIGALKSELIWMKALHADGLCVPAPMPTLDGNTLVILPATETFPMQYADIVSWMEGEQLGETGTPLPHSSERLVAIFGWLGETMAALHNSADAWHPPPEFYRPSWDQNGLLGENPSWGKFWDHPGLAPQEARQLFHLRKLLSDKLGAAERSGLDYGLIHADLVRENVLVRGKQISFIDFDDCGYGFRLFDIATTLLKNRSEPEYPALEAALIAGYRNRRPLSAAALKSLPLFITLRSLTYIGWLAQRPEIPDAQGRLKRYLADSLNLVEAGGFL